jgi:hypothetical protein
MRERHGSAVRLTGAAAAGTLLLALAACSAVDHTAGLGLPTQPPDDPVPGARADVGGTLRVESNGCFTLESDAGDRRWIVWPAGFAADGDAVRLAGSQRAGDGDRLAGVGADVDASALPAWTDVDSYFHSFGVFCDADRLGVVVLDEVALS